MSIDVKKCSECSLELPDFTSPDPINFPIPSIEKPSTEHREKIHRCTNNHQNIRYWSRQIMQGAKKDYRSKEMQSL